MFHQPEHARRHHSLGQFRLRSGVAVSVFNASRCSGSLAVVSSRSVRSVAITNRASRSARSMRSRSTRRFNDPSFNE
jgi:hypothetical protein